MIKNLIQKYLPFILTIKRNIRTYFYQCKLHQNFTLAQTVMERLPFEITSYSLDMIQKDHDITYQKNKVKNLKILRKRFHGIVIKPKETLSFLSLQYGANREEQYAEALVIEDGKLVAREGGGLCMLSNMLYYCSLHTPLEVIERHPHKKKYFKEPFGTPIGVDATVLQGWLDLKIYNPTNDYFQVWIEMDDIVMTVKILSSKEKQEDIKIFNKNYRLEGSTEVVEVWKKNTNQKTEELLYTNRQMLGEAR